MTWIYDSNPLISSLQLFVPDEGRADHIRRAFLGACRPFGSLRPDSESLWPRIEAIIEGRDADDRQAAAVRSIMETAPGCGPWGPDDRMPGWASLEVCGRHEPLVVLTTPTSHVRLLITRTGLCVDFPDPGSWSRAHEITDYWRAYDLKWNEEYAAEAGTT